MVSQEVVPDVMVGILLKMRQTFSNVMVGTLSLLQSCASPSENKEAARGINTTAMRNKFMVGTFAGFSFFVGYGDFCDLKPSVCLALFILGGFY
jgi:hypothetical protein